MRSPFLTAVGAGAGTFVTLALVTGLVSGATLTIAKRVIRQHKRKAATKCLVCDGAGYLDCQICMGKAIVRCRPPMSLQLLRRSRPPAAGEAIGSQVHCSCPACGTTRLQRCLNCLGDGKVCLPS